MAPVVIYVVAVVGTVAAAIAFKEFVYEPHIAPKVHQWSEEFKAKRRAKKAQRANAIAVPLFTDKGASTSGGDPSPGDSRGGFGFSSGSLLKGGSESAYELDSFHGEVHEWRKEVSNATATSSTLRNRKNPQPAAESSALINTETETHVLFDPADDTLDALTSPASSSRVSSPAPALSASSLSASSFHAPPQLPTPDASVHAAARAPSAASRRSLTPVDAHPHPEAQEQNPFSLGDPFSDIHSLTLSPSHPPTNTHTSPSPSHTASPHQIPSLSLSHGPPTSTQDDDLEFLSAPSSRPSSPFSEFSLSAASGSGRGEREQFHSFAQPPAAGTGVRSVGSGSSSHSQPSSSSSHSHSHSPLVIVSQPPSQHSNSSPHSGSGPHSPDFALLSPSEDEEWSDHGDHHSEISGSSWMSAH